MKKFLLCAGVAACAFAFSANATELEIKPYVGLDYVYSMSDIEKVNGINAFEEDLNAFAVSAGAKLHPNFGVEMFYQKSEEGEKKFANGKTNDEYQAYGIDLQGYLPVAEKLDLIGSLGFGYYDVDIKAKANSPAISADGDDQGAGYRLGLGAQYNFTENWGARLMARYVDIDIDGLDNMVDITAGVRYSF